MARLLLFPLPLLPLVVVTSLLGASPAVADRPGVQNGHLFNNLPRPRLHEMSLDDLENTLDVLTDLLEERRLPSGETGFVSRLVAPTLHTDSVLCQKHTQIYWEQFTSGAAEAIWPTLSKYLRSYLALL